MGRFFSNVQIKNTGNREQFISSFCDLMKKRNLVQCSDDDKEVQYILAFSEGGWVTLASNVYKSAPKQVHDDAQQIAKEMNTSGFSMDIVDSDWAYIDMFSGSDIHDIVIAGRSEFPEEQSPKGRQECWEQLLAQGKKWEQLSEIWNKNEVFVEDAMQEAASVLGIEPKYMISEYDDFNSKADTNSDILPLFFKKNITVSKNSEKKLTLNAAFKQVFGEALEPLGFKKVKGRQPYFVRVASGGEIIHVISYRKEWCSKQGYKAFSVYCGVATVYRRLLNLELGMDYNINWLQNISEIYRCSDNFEFENDKQYLQKISQFSYKYNDNESLTNTIKKAADVVKSLVMPVLDKTINLNACIEYYNKYKVFFRFYDEKRLFGNDNLNNNDNEGLIMILVKPDDNYFTEKEEEYRTNLKSDLDKGLISTDFYKSMLKNSLEDLHREKNNLLEVLNDPIKYSLAIKELNHRRYENTKRMENQFIFIKQ